MNIKIKNLLILWLFLLALPSVAAELKLNGMASYWSGASEVYVAALLLDVPSSDVNTLLKSQQHKRMDLYISSKRWRERDVAKEWQKAIDFNNSSAQIKKHINDLHNFLSVFKGPLRRGDRLSIDYTPKKASVSLNNVPLLDFADPEFFVLLLRTWVGPQLPYSSFLDQITGKDNSMLPELKEQTVALNFSSSRQAEIKQWLDGSFVNDGDDMMEKNRYRIEVTRAILRRVVYPSRALRTHDEGTSLVKLSLDNNGRLLDYSIYKSSGSKSLDRSALAAIDKADFPNFPASIKSKRLEFLVPVKFVLP